MKLSLHIKEILFRSDKKFFLNIFYIILFFFWSVSFSKFFVVQLKSVKPLFRLYSLSEDRKYELIDGKFYNFIKMCDKLIPIDVDVMFIISPNEYLASYGKGSFLCEYYKYKITYYLFPRRIFNRKEWIREESDHLIVYILAIRKWVKNNKVDYKIFYNPENDLFSLYYKNRLIIYAN